jgi:hypothetical protein
MIQTKRVSRQSTVLILTGLFLTVALAGCHHGTMAGKKTAAQVGTHSVKVDRHFVHYSNTDYRKGTFYKYAEKGVMADFLFTLTDDRVAVDGHELGLLRPNDEVRIDDDGVVVKNAEKNVWLDHGASKAYLAENAKQVTAAK